MTAQIKARGGRLRVRCDDPTCGRPLDWTVDTLDHADNLAAKHDREYHPGQQPAAKDQDYPTLDLTAAARLVVSAYDNGAARHLGDPHAIGRLTGLLEAWGALTGAEDTDDAMTLARAYAATKTTAHVAPF